MLISLIHTPLFAIFFFAIFADYCFAMLLSYEDIHVGVIFIYAAATAAVDARVTPGYTHAYAVAVFFLLFLLMFR